MTREHGKQSPTAAQECDFVVIGGGPAGATAAALLAEHGHRVLVLEAARFPRFAVGELIAATSFWRVWNRLGISEADLDARFIRKYGGIFQSPCGQEFEFNQNVHPDDPTCRPFVYNLERASYDLMLLDHARAKGAEVAEEALVEDLLQDEAGRVVGVRYEHEGSTHEIRCKLVVDASGRANVVARKLGLRLELTEMKSFAVFAHYEGALRVTGREEGNLRVMFAEDMWMWWAPLRSPKHTVGLVVNKDVYWDEYAADPEAFFDKYVQQFPYCAQRLRGAERITGFRPVAQGGNTSAVGYHYEAKELVGEGWALVGDAGGFVDPIFAAGLFAAQSSATWLADELHAASSEGDLSKARLLRYEHRFRDEFAPLLTHVRKFATDYFNPRFVDFFVATGVRHPHIGRLYVDTFIANDRRAIEKYARLMTRFLSGLQASESAAAAQREAA